MESLLLLSWQDPDEVATVGLRPPWRLLASPSRCFSSALQSAQMFLGEKSAGLYSRAPCWQDNCFHSWFCWHCKMNRLRFLLFVNTAKYELYRNMRNRTKDIFRLSRLTWQSNTLWLSLTEKNVTIIIIMRGCKKLESIFKYIVHCGTNY